jgi:hypothetical protein
MSYEIIRLASDKLTYREKMKLAQYLIQAAIKEEESLNPDKRIAYIVEQPQAKPNQESVDSKNMDAVAYVKERLLKSKPSKKQSLMNFIGAMFQFQGGIEDKDIEALIERLVGEDIIVISGNKVTYI